MRILFLSNFYPPARPGGYTQWCHEVARGLEARGHEIGVLTSRYELEKAPPEEKNIFRLLHLEGNLVYYEPLRFFTHWKRQKQENEAIVEQVITEFAPDLVFVWGMWAMSKTLPALAERLLPSRVVYYLSDYWPAAVDNHTAYWKSPANRWFMRPVKWVLRAIAMSMLAKEGKFDLKLDHVICVSAAVRDILVNAGLPLDQAQVIHGGTDVERFADTSMRNGGSSRLRLLYAGQLVRHKGVHTAIEAVAKLVNEHDVKQLHLTVVGSGHPTYEAFLHALVDREELHDCVSFYGPAAKSEMPAILQQADVLVFPSVYDEPFARMTQEAMLAGLTVVGTTTGGTKEILVEGENGLTFAAEDADTLAKQIRRLVTSPNLCRQLAEAGRRTVLENYTLDKMVDQIEDYLQEVVSTAQTKTAVSREIARDY